MKTASKSKKEQSSENSLWNVFLTTMVTVFGVFGSFIVIALFSVLTIGPGVWLIMRNSKEDPKTQRVKINWNFQSGFGAFLICIGMIPWLPYLFQGLMFNLGAILAENVVNMFFPGN